MSDLNKDTVDTQHTAARIIFESVFEPVRMRDMNKFLWIWYCSIYRHCNAVHFLEIQLRNCWCIMVMHQSKYRDGCVCFCLSGTVDLDDMQVSDDLARYYAIYTYMGLPLSLWLKWHSYSVSVTLMKAKWLLALFCHYLCQFLANKCKFMKKINILHHTEAKTP